MKQTSASFVEITGWFWRNRWQVGAHGFAHAFAACDLAGQAFAMGECGSVRLFEQFSGAAGFVEQGAAFSVGECGRWRGQAGQR